MTFGFALYNLSRMNKLETFILVAGIDESQESKKEFDEKAKFDIAVVSRIERLNQEFAHNFFLLL